MLKSEFEKLIDDCEAVIFDYGGIFVDIFHQRAIEKIKNKSGSDPSELYGKNAQTSLFDKFETGDLSETAFLTQLKEKSGFTGDLDELKEAWNSMLGDHPYERLEYLKELGRRKRLFMLSNINEIHEAFLQLKIARDPNLKGFYEAFEKVYFSHKIGLRKPDAMAFKMIIDENGLEARKTAFVDDTIGHVEASRKLGLRGIHLDPPNSFILSV